jgi:hypothetical protein
MALVRKLIATDVYEGRCIESRFLGPDLLAYAENSKGEMIELAGFYTNSSGAFAACRHIDAEIKEEKRHV